MTRSKTKFSRDPGEISAGIGERFSHSWDKREAGDATGDALEKSAGSRDKSLDKFPSSGEMTKLSAGRGCNSYPAGMSGEQLLPSGDPSWDN